MPDLIKGLDCSTQRVRAKDPRNTSLEAHYGYDYSYLCVDGDAATNEFGQIELSHGELCVQSRTVYVEAHEVGIRVWVGLFPLVKTKPIQNGSVSTQYIVTAYKDKDIVEVALRSTGGSDSVWISKSNRNGEAHSIDKSLNQRAVLVTAQGDPTGGGDDGRENISIQVSPLNYQQNEARINRIEYLHRLAEREGVFTE